MSEVKRYRKLPVEIEAIHLVAFGDFTRAHTWITENGGNASIARNNVIDRHSPDGDYLLIRTLEGNMEAHVGWWVIRGVKGEFYGCEPEIFGLTYEPA